MNSDIRSSNKVSSNNIICDSNETMDVGKTLKEIKLAQDQQNVTISECLTNVSKMISGMSINNHDNYNQNTPDMWTKKTCWLHHGANHTIFNCNIF